MASPLLLAATISAAILTGFVTAFMESLRPAQARRFGKSPDELPKLGAWLHVAWVFLMPLAGWLVDAWGVHSILFTGSLALSFGVAWLAIARTLSTHAWGVLAVAWGGAAMTIAGLRLMPEAFPLGPRPTPEGAICVGFLFVAIAALFTLSAYPHVVEAIGFRNALLVTALVCLTPAGILSFMESTDLPGALAAPGLGDAADNPRLWLLALLILLWFPIEHALDIWPRPFLKELGYAPGAVAALIGGFWLWFLASRLAMGWVFLQGFEIWLIFVLALIPPMVLGNLVGAYAPSSGYFGFWLVGACYGPLLPAFLGMALQMFDKRCLILGLLLSIDSLCALVIQPWYARYVQSHTARQAMRIPLLLGLLLSGAILVLLLIRPGA